MSDFVEASHKTPAGGVRLSSVPPGNEDYLPESYSKNAPAVTAQVLYSALHQEPPQNPPHPRYTMTRIKKSRSHTVSDSMHVYIPLVYILTCFIYDLLFAASRISTGGYHPPKRLAGGRRRVFLPRRFI